MDTELVLAVPRTDLFAARLLHGFVADPDTVSHFLGVVAAGGRFVPRPPAEQDEGLKQIVPYGVVWHQESVFLFQRGEKGAEAGLRGRWSLGLGGHVNPADGDEVGPAMLERALRRELAEEVVLDRPSLELWGVLNDDSDPVGRRHFGFVYRVQVAGPAAHSREPGKIQGLFVSLPTAQSRREEMETWSQIVLRALARWNIKRSNA